MSGPRNTLEDLNNHLFAQLERLGEEDLEGENLKEEIDRAKAVGGIAKSVIDNGKLVLEARRFQDQIISDEVTVPRMLTGNQDDKKIQK